MVTLLLNADYTALRVLSWQKAVCMVLERRARLVVPYADRVVRSKSMEVALPSVIALERYTKARPRVRFSVSSVFARDGYRCSYCGFAPRGANGELRSDGLTLDHVVPRSAAVGGCVKLPWDGKRTVAVTSWANATTACRPCNFKKANRTPDEAGMPLARIPAVPTSHEAVRISIGKIRIHDDWRPYLGDFGDHG